MVTILYFFLTYVTAALSCTTATKTYTHLDPGFLGPNNNDVTVTPITTDIPCTHADSTTFEYTDNGNIAGNHWWGARPTTTTLHTHARMSFWAKFVGGICNPGYLFGEYGLRCFGDFYSSWIDTSVGDQWSYVSIVISVT